MAEFPTCEQMAKNVAEKALDEFLYHGKSIREWMKIIVDQEPKTGHWIPTYGNVKCSVCGSVKDSRKVGKATHYCDFCGAKMVEPQETETWNGYHGQITAPKGTFEKIYEDAESEDKE